MTDWEKYNALVFAIKVVLSLLYHNSAADESQYSLIFNVTLLHILKHLINPFDYGMNFIWLSNNEKLK